MNLKMPSATIFVNELINDTLRTTYSGEHFNELIKLKMVFVRKYDWAVNATFMHFMVPSYKRTYRILWLCIFFC